MTTTPGESEPLAGMDPVSIIGADLDAEYAVELDRQLGLMRDAPPEAIGSFLDVIARPAAGYREIANADGIHWHERIEPGDDDPR